MDSTPPRWEPFTPGVPLEPDAVHVVAFPLGGGDGQDAWQRLSPDERARAERLREREHRERFVAARAALRGILGRHLGRPPGQVALVTDERGKPMLAGAAPLHFNLSHSHGQAVVALACGREVGVDVEKVRAEVAIADVAERVFSLREREGLFALPPRDQRQAFFACWTRKEALLKATGDGLRRAPASIDLAPRPDETRWTRWAVIDGVAFAVCDLPALPGFGAAVAVRGGARRVRCFALAEGAAV